MRSGRSSTFAALGAVAWGLLAAAPAGASPEDLFGYGGRTSAMGATGAAHARGYESAFHNPALASTIRENALTLGYSGAVFALDAVGPGLPGRASEAPAKGMYIGADLPIPLGGKLRDRIGVALAFYTPADVIIRGRVLYPEKTQFPLLGDRAQSLTLRGGIGVDVGWGLRVGVGFAALAEIRGTVVVATDVTGRVGTRVEDQLVATYAPVAGVTYEVPRSKVTLGAVYRGEIDARFSVVIDATKLASLAIPLFNISGLAQYDPAEIAVEAARVDALNVLAAQLVYKRWGDFPGVIEPTVVCSEGGPGACGLAPPQIPWRDTVAARVGAEQGFELAPGVVLFARGGGFVETSALPANVPGSEAFDLPGKRVVAVPTRYFDATRVALTTGVGLSLGRRRAAGARGAVAPSRGLPLDLDLFGQYHVLLPRTITSTDADGGALTTGEASGHVTAFGLTAGVKF